MYTNELSESQSLRKKFEQQFEQLNQSHHSELYDFERNFLEKYIQNDNIDETFIQKLFNYIKVCVSARSVQNKNRDLKFAQKDFAKFLLEYLIKKYILGFDATIIPETVGSKSKVCSKRIQRQEFEKREKNLFQNLQEILSFLDEVENNKQVQRFIAANIGNNELLALSLFATRFFNANALFLEAVETEIVVNTVKQPIKKLVYNYWRDSESSGKPYMSVKLEAKPYGAQFGGRISTSGAQSKNWYFKTHQEGSQVRSSTGIMYLSKSVPLASPVNANELFVYKILEKLGWGPKVNFVANPFIENDMFIITNDLEEGSNGFKMAINCKKNDLSPAQEEDLKVNVTMFDLINRILMLNDLNEWNYGLSADNSIKIVDFRAPSQIIGPYNEEIFFENFMEVKGGIYPKPLKKGTIDQRLAPSILKQYGKDNKQKIKEGITALQLIDRNQLVKAIEESKSEVLAFINKQDNIASCQTADLLGLDSNKERGNLNDYATVIMKNYDVIRECLEKKSKSLKTD